MKKEFTNITKVVLCGIPAGGKQQIEIDGDGLALTRELRSAIKKGWLVEAANPQAPKAEAQQSEEFKRTKVKTEGAK